MTELFYRLYGESGLSGDSENLRWDDFDSASKTNISVQNGNCCTKVPTSILYVGLLDFWTNTKTIPLPGRWLSVRVACLLSCHMQVVGLTIVLMYQRAGSFLLHQLLPRHVLHKKYCVPLIKFYVLVCLKLLLWSWFISSTSTDFWEDEIGIVLLFSIVQSTWIESSGSAQIITNGFVISGFCEAASSL